MPTDLVDPSGLLIIIARGYNCRMVELRDGSTGLVCERIEYTFWDDNPSGGPVGPPVQSSSGGGGITDSRGGDDCIPWFPCPAAEKERKRKIDECLKKVREEFEEKVRQNFQDNSPDDGEVWIQIIIWGAAGSVGGPLLGIVGGIAGGTSAAAGPALRQHRAGKKLGKEYRAAQRKCAPLIHWYLLAKYD